MPVLSERCSGFSRIFARGVLYLLDNDQGAADLRSRKVKVLNILIFPPRIFTAFSAASASSFTEPDL